MGRVIKFRAWDEADGVHRDEGSMSPIQNPNCDATAVMQFTGLLDKNGVEIYEGDIVLAPVTIEVEQGEDFSYFNRHEDGHRTRHCCKPKPCFIEYTGKGYVAAHSSGVCHPFWIATTSDYEVIGNIHENPELLEQSDG